MSRRLACLEYLDDAHGRAAARARLKGRLRGDVLRLGRRRSDVEQLAGEHEVVGLHAARQQTVVADAVEVIIVFYFVPGCVKIPLRSGS